MDEQSLHTPHISCELSIGTKRGAIKENCSTSWHKRLGHISKERILRLMKDGLLHNLDFNDYSVCIGCIKGKQSNRNKKGAKGATRSSELLEIIHTDMWKNGYTMFYR